MCLPTEPTPVTTRPARSTVDSEGWRISPRVNVLPASASCSRCAVRKTVSPSGMSGQVRFHELRPSDGTGLGGRRGLVHGLLVHRFDLLDGLLLGLGEDRAGPSAAGPQHPR